VSDLSEDLAAGSPPPPKRKTLGQIADLLERNGIDVEDVGRVQKVNVWQGFYKDADGEAHTVDMAGITLSPHWAEGPQWPVAQPATPAKIAYGKRPKPHTDGLHRTVLLPDPQIGYWRNGSDLTPMHDELAMAAALDVARAVNPDRIVNLGDFLDLAEFSSKFDVHPEFVMTTQDSIQRGHDFLAEQRAILGPDGELVLIAGNHDDRLGKAVLRNAKAALRLRRADTPEGWPVMSVPNLLALDALDCRYVSGYPAGSLKLADGCGSQTPLYAVHERGLDVVKVAKQQRQSYVQGHTHRVAMHSETYELDGEPVDVEAYALGSLCSRTGRVPSTKGNPDDMGRPVTRIESWQHAVGILTVAPSGAWWMEVVRIRDGEAVAAGSLLRGC
jgi:hypothetical protein